MLALPVSKATMGLVARASHSIGRAKPRVDTVSINVPLVPFDTWFLGPIRSDLMAEAGSGYRKRVTTLGAYTVAEAARYVKAPPATVRAWFLGTATGHGPFRPLLKIDDPKNRMLSFRNLVELHSLNAIRRKHRITFSRAKRAMNELSSYYNSEHPFADHDLFAGGGELFPRVYGTLTGISDGIGQTYLEEVLRPTLDRIERGVSGEASKLYPLPYSGACPSAPMIIEINPSVQFGLPCLSETGIPTWIIHGRNRDGDSVECLADDYNISTEQVQQAITYEKCLRPAA